MFNYNNRQKYYIAIVILTFILLNLASLVIVIVSNSNTGNVKGISIDASDIIFNAVKSNSNNSSNVEIKQGDSFYLKGNNISVDNSYIKFVSTDGSAFQFFDKDNIRLESGLSYINNSEKIKLTIGSKIVNLSADTKVFVDADEMSIIILKGEIEYNSKFISEASIFNVKSERVSVLNKEDLLKTNKYNLLNDLLLSKGIFVKEINFVQEVKLDNLSPSDNIRTNLPTEIITGKTSIDNSVYINDVEVNLDFDGNFSKEVSLENGVNTFVIKVVSSSADVLQRTLVISRE